MGNRLILALPGRLKEVPMNSETREAILCTEAEIERRRSEYHVYQHRARYNTWLRLTGDKTDG